MRTILAVTLVAVLSLPAQAQSNRGTWAFDYRNIPQAAKIIGFEIVALSSRGALLPAADTLRAEGSHVFVWIQPTVAGWNNEIIGSRPTDRTQYPWDSALYDSATAHGAIMRDSTGAWLRLFPDNPSSPVVLDFRNLAFVQAYTTAFVAFYGSKGDGALLDYGCGDLGWMQLKVPASTWPPWRLGYLAFIDGLRAAGIAVQCQCDQWARGLAERCTGILHEAAGWSLNPSAKVWTSTSTRERSWTRVHDLDPQRRRLFAAMALVTDSPFNWSDLRSEFGHAFPRQDNLRDPEHFELWMGSKLTNWYQVRVGVYQRNYSHGFALVNLSTTDYKVQNKFTVRPQDGFVAQIRDKTMNSLIAWKTNIARDPRRVQFFLD